MFPTSNPRRAFSLVEVLLAVFLLSMLSLITVGGMIMHGRIAKANLELQRMAENSRRFVDEVQIEALDATVIKVEAGPAGPNTVLTIGKPDPNNSSNILVKQFAYIDADGKNETIGDNKILARTVDTPAATTGEEVVWYCSRVGTTPVFAQDTAAGKPLFNINVRVGDRTVPGNNDDNRFTGNGTQVFMITASVSSL